MKYFNDTASHCSCFCHISIILVVASCVVGRQNYQHCVVAANAVDLQRMRQHCLQFPFRRDCHLQPIRHWYLQGGVGFFLVRTKLVVEKSGSIVWANKGCFSANLLAKHKQSHPSMMVVSFYQESLHPSILKFRVDFHQAALGKLRRWGDSGGHLAALFQQIANFLSSCQSHSNVSTGGDTVSSSL